MHLFPASTAKAEKLLLCLPGLKLVIEREAEEIDIPFVTRDVMPVTRERTALLSISTFGASVKQPKAPIEQLKKHLKGDLLEWAP